MKIFLAFGLTGSLRNTVVEKCPIFIWRLKTALNLVLQIITFLAFKYSLYGLFFC